MILGLRQGTVELVEHDPKWKNEAAKVIKQLWLVFGPTAVDIQHFGSTAISGIKAKPIIDITVGIRDFKFLDELLPKLKTNGIDRSPGQPFEDIVLFSVDDSKGKRIYNISVVKYGGKQWQNYINFRNYMNRFPEKAMAYDELKDRLSKQYPKDITAYTEGKKAFIENCLLETNVQPERVIAGNMFTFEEAQEVLEELVNELPPEIFKGLNCGVSLVPETMYDRNGLLILGQYHFQPQGLGRYVTIYYGSITIAGGHMSPHKFREKLKHVLHHELTHHLEHMAGDRSLEIQDEHDINRMLAQRSNRPRPGITPTRPAAPRLRERLYDRITDAIPITRGWSGDKKFCVTTTDGIRCLLRITPISRYEAQKSMFAMMQQVAALGVPMCLPMEFGTCNEGVYSLQSWIDGEDLGACLANLSEADQYAFGFQAGEILKKIHSLPAPAGKEDWESHYNRKLDSRIEAYHNCGLHHHNDQYILAYIKENRHLLANRPRCFNHGDYHIGNMMLENGQLRIIDFDRYDFDDPWAEFNRIVWCAEASPNFATGQINGYFNNNPPQDFFRLLALYIAENTISSLPWAISFGEKEIETMKKQCQDVLGWFDNMQNPVPNWYLGLGI